MLLLLVLLLLIAIIELPRALFSSLSSILSSGTPISSLLAPALLFTLLQVKTLNKSIRAHALLWIIMPLFLGCKINALCIANILKAPKGRGGVIVDLVDVPQKRREDEEGRVLKEFGREIIG